MGKIISWCLLALLFLTGCSARNDVTQSTVSVTGVGTVMAQPDMVIMRLQCSYIAPTTGQAKDAVDTRMKALFDILSEEHIESNYIRTVSLSYDTAREYINGRSVVVGQQAQQTVMVTIKNITGNQTRLPVLLDKVTGIDNMVINGISFDIDNKTDLFQQTRELAYQKALDKAAQYAALSGKKIARPLTISEGQGNVYSVPRGAVQANVAFKSAMPAFDEAAALPSGEQEISSEVAVTFLMK